MTRKGYICQGCPKLLDQLEPVGVCEYYWWELAVSITGKGKIVEPIDVPEGCLRKLEYVVLEQDQKTISSTP